MRSSGIILLIITSTVTQAFAYSGGSGTAEDPYQIAAAADLILLGGTPDDYDKHFVLTADIDLDPNLPGGRVFDRAVIAAGWKGPFNGVFDGNNHTISHLTINGEGGLGLFYELGSTAVVLNLGLEAVDVHGTMCCIGGLAGDNAGIISACYCIGTVEGNNYVGGLVGTNGGSIVACHSTARVSGDRVVGGLVGRNCGGPGYVCRDGTLIMCYSTGTVDGREVVGGLVGLNRDWDGPGSVIFNCYSASIVTGDLHTGGLVGLGPTPWGIANSFWDIEASGQASSDGGTGLTTTEMQEAGTYLNAGWDFHNESKNGVSEYWQISPGNYPSFHYPVMAEGLGTAEEPFLIRDRRDLGTLWVNPTAHYRLESSINLSGITWSIPVVPVFDGILDGNGYTVHHLTISGVSHLGLFGELRNRACVSNLGISDANVTGTERYIGIIAGRNDGCIRSSFSAGNCRGRNHVGGLIGSNPGIVANCYCTGTVTSEQTLGPMGAMGGNVMMSYSTVLVNDDSNLDEALLDPNDIEKHVGVLWGSPLSGQTGGGVGVGLTNSEMKNPQMYALNGWNHDPNWIIDAGSDYPRLIWERTTGEPIPDPNLDWIEGMGTFDEPYEIVNAEQLVLTGKACILWDKHFILGSDIDLGDKFFIAAVIPEFLGTFNGIGHTIQNLTISGSNRLGLFGTLKSKAEIVNLELLDVNVTGFSSIGGLVGYNELGSVYNCQTSGAILAELRAGGLVGENERGSITFCNSTGTVSSRGTAGGLVGSNSGDVTDCYSMGAVSGGGSVGGLVGYHSSGTISKSYSTGDVSTDRWSAPVGGLVGSTSSGEISNSYSVSNVNGISGVGGLLGAMGEAHVTHCYSTGLVTGDEEVGGLVGSNWDGLISNCFWDILSSGQTVMCGAHGENASGCDSSFGLPTLEMQNPEAYSGSGWDFIGEEDNGTENIWSILPGHYPQLAWGLYANSPDPANGAIDVLPSTTLNWRSATRFVAHDIYLSDCAEAVADATRGSLDVFRGQQAGEVTSFDPGILEFNKTYYWRIDEVNETDLNGPWKGEVWRFTTTDYLVVAVNGTEDVWWIAEGQNYPQLAWKLWAYSPGPPNGALDVPRSIILRWHAAAEAIQHDVYFGDNQNAVAHATKESLGIYRGRQPVQASSFDPGLLELNKTYYWRIDEAGETDPTQISKGSIWNFTTRDHVILSLLDDFENYSSDWGTGLSIWETWLDGFYVDANSPGNATGSLISDIEQSIVYSGFQSMPTDYNNVDEPFYSEVERTWETAQDWTNADADTLTLYFRGQADNSLEPLYIAVEDATGNVGVLTNPNDNAVLSSDWQKWHNSLADLRGKGIDVASVKKLYIGVGNRNDPQPGGLGRFYIDDIRLTKRMP